MHRIYTYPLYIQSVSKPINTDCLKSGKVGQHYYRMDPYEKRTVYVNATSDGRGDGLFAKRFVKAGDTLAYYAGIVRDVSKRPFFTSNQTLDEAFDVHRNLIVLQGNLHMTIPREFWTLDRYRATLGHKANHGFGASVNAAFDSVFHPSYGIIRGIVALKRIEKGEEILVDYGYETEKGALLPDWYVKARNKLDKI